MYIGPEAMIPLASALAAITGFLLMFWRRTVGILRLGTQHITRKVSQLFAKR